MEIDRQILAPRAPGKARPQRMLSPFRLESKVHRLLIISSG
ncbi:hypothetical protein ACFSZS_15435 [Seohaeicola zhoushanensis]